MTPKKIFLFAFLFLMQILGAQTNNDSVLVHEEVNKLKNLRIKDSTKIELLLEEIKGLILVSETQQKENDLRFKQIIDSISQQKQLDLINRYDVKTNGIPVILYSDTLFYVYNDLPPLTAQERASHYAAAVKYLYKQPDYNADSLKIIANGDLLDIMYEDRIITSVSDLDGLWIGESQQKIAKNYLKAIVDTVQEYKDKNSLNQQIIRFAEITALLVLLFALFYGIKKLTLFLGRRFRENKHLLPKGISINNYQFIDRERLSNFVDKALWFFKYFLYLLAVFIFIPFMLRLFPQTEIYVFQLTKWVSAPFNSIKDSIFNYIPKLIKIILIVFIGKSIIRFLRYIAIEISRKRLVFNGFHPEWASPTFSIARFVLNVFILIMIFPLLPGADSIAFQGISVFLGILLSIGSSTAITNIVSGLVIVYMRPYKVGDWIKTKNVKGIVIEKNLLVTRLKTANNEDVTIPNSSVLNDHTINYSSIGKEQGFAISIQVHAKYDYESEQIENLLLQTATNYSDLDQNLKPYVLHLDLNQMYATYELNAYTFHSEKILLVKSELTKRVKNSLKAAGIEMTINNYFEIKSVADFTTNTKKIRLIRRIFLHALNSFD
ncbi:mechanosensitive ion channel family protein [Flavobacterium agricola]|uniref:Mechanosensitive ion channel family protein n=1 Tax=Flavobacterium agricola TaxID=2870839 RepID=A0ABY6LZM3_9FLAO|nr:mechanosensitive ion channel family protein [Flavobacterium agricola]UYW01736.1 mechanosensitive ion channel family protein [Flavobacterium agricola]